MHIWKYIYCTFKSLYLIPGGSLNFTWGHCSHKENIKYTGWEHLRALEWTAGVAETLMEKGEVGELWHHLHLPLLLLHKDPTGSLAVWTKYQEKEQTGIEMINCTKQVPIKNSNIAHTNAAYLHVLFEAFLLATQRLLSRQLLGNLFNHRGWVVHHTLSPGYCFLPGLVMLRRTVLLTLSESKGTVKNRNKI